MPHEPTVPALPLSASGLLFMPTSRPLAACSWFGASEALDAGVCTFVREIVDIFSILPLRHTLVVISSFVLLAHAMRVADEEDTDLLSLAKLDHLARGLVSQVTYPSFDTACHLVPGPLQFLPTFGILLAPCLSFGKLPVPHIALALEAANTTARDNQGRTCIRGDSREMNLPKGHCGPVRPMGLLGLWHLATDMQVQANGPDQHAGSAVLW